TIRWNGDAVDGGSYAFNPGDVLKFNSTIYHASKVVLVDVAGPNLSVSLGAKTITLLGMSIAQVTPSNFTFNDLSQILVGTNAGDSLTGTANGDQLHGLVG